MSEQESDKELWSLITIRGDGDCGFHAILEAFVNKFNNISLTEIKNIISKNILKSIYLFRIELYDNCTTITWFHNMNCTEDITNVKYKNKIKSYLRAVCIYFLYYIMYDYEEIDLTVDISTDKKKEYQDKYLNLFYSKFNLSEDEDDTIIPALEIEKIAFIKKKYEECLNNLYADIFFIIICSNLLSINTFIYVYYEHKHPIEKEYEWMSIKRSHSEVEFENSIFLFLTVNGNKSHYDVLIPLDEIKNELLLLKGDAFVAKVKEYNVLEIKKKEKVNYD